MNKKAAIVATRQVATVFAAVFAFVIIAQIIVVSPIIGFFITGALLSAGMWLALYHLEKKK